MKLKGFISKIIGRLKGFLKKPSKLHEYSAEDILDYISLDKDKNVQFFLLLRDVESEEIYCKIGMDQVPLGNVLYTFAKEDSKLKEVCITVATMLIEDDRKNVNSILSKGLLIPKADA